MILKEATPRPKPDGRRRRRLRARLFPKGRRKEKRQLTVLKERSEAGAPLRGEHVVMPEDRRSPRRVTFEPRQEDPVRPPALRRRSPTPTREKGKGKGKSKGKGKGKSKKGKDKDSDGPRRHDSRRDSRR